MLEMLSLTSELLFYTRDCLKISLIFGKLLKTRHKISQIQSYLIFLIVEVDHHHMSSPMLTREDREHSHTIASDLIPYQNLFVTSQIVLFVASNKDLIATSTVFLISPALRNTTTAWMVETAYNGGHFVMT